MLPYDRANMTFYSTVIEICVYLVPFPRWYGELFSESRRFYLSHLHMAPSLGWPRSNFKTFFGVRKLESRGYRVVCVILRSAYFVLWQTERRSTGRRADRRTDTFEHSIYRARSRGKRWYPIIYLISLSKVSLSSASYVGSQHNTARICCWAAPLQLVCGAGAISPAHRALSSKLVARHRWCCRSMGQTDLQSTVSSN